VSVQSHSPVGPFVGGRAGCVFWLTGLSGAGKSTLCRLLVQRLRTEGRSVVMLDGDELREVMAAEHIHGRADRLALAMRYAKLCKMLAGQGHDVAIATISLFKEIHDWNRTHLPGYVEIYLKVPLEELSRRDPKKIYERARRGELKNVAGVDLEVDFPVAPHLTLDHQAGRSVDKAFEILWEKLLQHKTP
jgi:cytidine diphosphoramidate kinase